MTPLKRLGLLVPSSNTVMEIDLQRSLADVATVHTARMFLAEPITPEGEAELLDVHSAAAARAIGTIEPDIVVFGCGSAATIRGRDADQRLRRELSELACAPVLGVFDVIADALRALKAWRVAVLVPYPEEIAAPMIAGFCEEGFEVESHRSMGIASNVEVGRVEPPRIVEQAVDLLGRNPKVEALVIACTNFRGLEARAQIQAMCGVHVVTSNTAVVDHALNALASEPIGAG